VLGLRSSVWFKARQRYDQLQALKAQGSFSWPPSLRLAPGTGRRYYHADSADEVMAASLAG
jgi:hypothetical protein